jgi:hypothetical protein
VLSSKGGVYHSVKIPMPAALKAARPEDSVKATTSNAYTLVGEAYWWNTPEGRLDIPAVPEEYEFLKGWVPRVEKWLEEGKLVAHPPEIKEGGLDGILEQVLSMGGNGLGPSGKRLVLLAD